MITEGNFVLMDISEFRPWLIKQSVSRTIDTAQIHHTWIPNHASFNGKNHLAMMRSMETSHKGRGFTAIAQNFTIFPDGKIGYSLSRPLNMAPAGIKGANSRGICCEIIGNFNKNGDKITPQQKYAVTHFYATLAEKFKLEVSQKNFRYHGWYTASGTYLGDYSPSRSAKTCPGDKWWGDGNTLADAKKGFFPDVQRELNKLKASKPEDITPEIPIPAPEKPIREEDKPMTPEEKKAQKEMFDAITERMVKQEEINIAQAKEIKKLQADVDGVTKNQSVTIPKWAEKPVYDFKNMKTPSGQAVLDTPNGRSLETYTNLTIIHRILDAQGLLKK